MGGEKAGGGGRGRAMRAPTLRLQDTPGRREGVQQRGQARAEGQSPSSCQACPLALGCSHGEARLLLFLQRCPTPRGIQAWVRDRSLPSRSLCNFGQHSLLCPSLKWDLTSGLCPRQSCHRELLLLPHTPNPTCPNPSYTLTSNATFSTMPSPLCAPLCCAWPSCVEGFPSCNPLMARDHFGLPWFLFY